MRIIEQKKRKNLKKENKKLKEKKEKLEQIKYAIPYGIPIISSDSSQQYYNVSDVGIDKKKLTWKSGIQYPTISFSPALDIGIYSTEVEFGGNGDSGIGIVRDSYTINSEENPYSGTNCQHMATFGGYSYSGGAGCINYKGAQNSGNTSYSGNQTVKLEYDSGKGTLILFINGTQQPVFVSGIREKVRFILSLYNSCGNCTIKSLKKLSAQTSVQMSNGKAVQW
ncbi:MAG: hypothetical protein EZS28_037648 [Streblomastix strix]|uniref:SPRY domain-containing protein n=1 Tax=Streblomastix strix TaxID=222440 RepID=A0A5J4UAZ3_9EUKA|nr:MAG: hypothetical protein EZS28_037648 [Streblomastix strix]